MKSYFTGLRAKRLKAHHVVHARMITNLMILSFIMCAITLSAKPLRTINIYVDTAGLGQFAGKPVLEFKEKEFVTKEAQKLAPHRWLIEVNAPLEVKSSLTLVDFHTCLEDGSLKAYVTTNNQKIEYLSGTCIITGSVWELEDWNPWDGRIVKTLTPELHFQIKNEPPDWKVQTDL